jgi:hypothetical protein
MGNISAPILAKKRIDDAVDQREATRQKLEEESLENRKAYERFYNNLALFSSGTIALSITYLGYLKSLPHKPVYPRVLIASWIVLLACLFAALFYSFFNSHYVYFGRMREYTEKVATQNEVQLEEIDKLLLVNTAEEVTGAKTRFGKAARDFSEKARYSKRREDAYFLLWVWTGRLARFAFPIGIGLLVFFAIENM